MTDIEHSTATPPHPLGLSVLVTTLLLAMVFQTVFAQEGVEDIPPTKRWHEPFVTLLDVDFGEAGFQARWEYFHCGCGDILVRMEQSAPDGVMTGELLLVEGKVLAARGMVSMAPDLEPMLESPSIMLHLAFALLERALPKGPSALEARSPLAYEEPLLELELDSGVATARFPAPWSVSGEAWPSGEGQRRFDFRFDFHNPLPEDPENSEFFKFSGGQDYRRDDFPFPDDLPLDGWQVQWVTRGEMESSDAEAGLTLGALREQARIEGTPEA